MIKIRLKRLGRVHTPVYNIVATDSRNPRDGKFLEKLGVYHPSNEKTLSNINTDGIKTWISKGAELSSTVATLLKKNKVQL